MGRGAGSRRTAESESVRRQPRQAQPDPAWDDGEVDTEAAPAAFAHGPRDDPPPPSAETAVPRDDPVLRLEQLAVAGEPLHVARTPDTEAVRAARILLVARPGQPFGRGGVIYLSRRPGAQPEPPAAATG